MTRIMRIAILGTALAAAPAWAQLYKWTDERGTTHYSEKPPANKGAPVTLRDATGGPKEPQQPQRNETDLQRQEREFQERQGTRERELARDRRRQEDSRGSESSRDYACRTATLDLDTMQRNPTNYSYAQQSEARARIARNCR